MSLKNKSNSQLIKEIETLQQRIEKLENTNNSVENKPSPPDWINLIGYDPMLTKNNLLLSHILENSLNEIYVFDSKTLKFIHVNHGARINLGYTMEELQIMTPVDLKPDFTLSLFKKMIQPLSTGEKNKIIFITQHERKNGGTYPVEVHLQLATYGDESVFVAIILDITQRENAENLLKESEFRYREFLEKVTSWVGILGTNGQIKFWNKAAEHISGYSRDQAIGNPNMIEWLYPDESYRKTIIQKINDIVNQGPDLINFESTITCRDGSNRVISWNTIDVYNIDGSLFGNMSIGVDITAQKQAEGKLRDREEEFRQLFENESDAIIVFDATFLRIENANQAALDLFKYDKDDFLKLSLKDITSDATIINKALQEIKKTKGQNVKIPLSYMKKNEGTLFPVEISPGIFSAKGHKKIIGAMRDISDRISAEQKRQDLEAQLRQVQKMEAIGTLAGGIAHEFNNLLTPILGYTELLMRKYPNPVQNQDFIMLERIHSAGERAKFLIRQILTFSHKSVSEKKSIQLSVIIEEALNLIRPTIPPSISIRQEMDLSIPPLLLSKEDIHQVVINLCVNSIHAMPDGGKLILSLENEKPCEFIDSRGHAINGQFICLRIHDTGSGMDKTTLEHIFDPFFTTKKVGTGTGLGLSYVLGIIEQHGGHVDVESSLNQGTAFYLYFPTSLANETLQAPRNIPSKSPKNKQILCIDDEIMIKEMTCDMLEILGFDVVGATHPLKAISLFEMNPNEFDLVITDYSMPEMTGEALAQKIKTIRPNIPIILCSGYRDITNNKSVNQLNVDELLMKPYQLEELNHAIEHVFKINK